MPDPNFYGTEKARKALVKIGSKWTGITNYGDCGRGLAITAMIDWLVENWGSLNMFQDEHGWCVFDGHPPKDDDEARWIELSTLDEALVAAILATEE